MHHASCSLQYCVIYQKKFHPNLRQASNEKVSPDTTDFHGSIQTSSLSFRFGPSGVGNTAARGSSITTSAVTLIPVTAQLRRIIREHRHNPEPVAAVGLRGDHGKDIKLPSSPPAFIAKPFTPKFAVFFHVFLVGGRRNFRAAP